MKSKEPTLRPIEINGYPYDIGTKAGYFHRWCLEPQFDAEMAWAKTMALIELSDGKVKLIPPEYLKFKVPYSPK